jgi:NAD(P) transhydrogenase
MCRLTVIYDVETVIDLDVLPRTMTIVGGVIGCEYASIFTPWRKGNDHRSPQKLLSFLDHEIADALVYLMRKYGVRSWDSAERSKCRTGRLQLPPRQDAASSRIDLYAAGRTGNTEDLT